MPIDISTLATTRSMTTKGMKMRKPIWKAVFSSLVTKAGTSRRSGTSSGVAICTSPPQAREEREVGLARLREHELAERRDAFPRAPARSATCPARYGATPR